MRVPISKPRDIYAVLEWALDLFGLISVVIVVALVFFWFYLRGF